MSGISLTVIDLYDPADPSCRAMFMRIICNPVQSTSIWDPGRKPHGPKGAARRDLARARVRGCCHDLLSELVPRPTIQVSSRSSQDREADQSAWWIAGFRHRFGLSKRSRAGTLVWNSTIDSLRLSVSRRCQCIGYSSQHVSVRNIPIYEECNQRLPLTCRLSLTRTGSKLASVLLRRSARREIPRPW